MESFKEVSCEYFYQLPIVWKYPKIKIICKLISFLNLSYRPFEEVKYPESINTFLRFSQEVMLLYVGKK
jgi:hypothetical protein